MSMETAFSRYGSPSDEWTVTLRGYFTRPDKLTAGSVARNDQSAERLISEAQELIADLNEYRRLLAKRYAELSTMAYSLTLELKRHIHRDNSKSYSVTIIRTLDDGTEIQELRETYNGTDRHAAIKRFAALQKERPGINAVKDIEKRSWER